MNRHASGDQQPSGCVLTPQSGVRSDRRPVVVHYRSEFAVPSETFIRETVTRHRRYNAVVLTHQYIPDASIAGTPYAEFPAGGPVGLARWSPLVRIARRSRILRAALPLLEPAVIHAHFGEEGVSAVASARRLSVPLVVTFYGYDATELARHAGWRRRFRMLFRHAALVLAEGPHLAARLVELGAPAPRVVVQPIPVRLELFPFMPPAVPGATDEIVVLQACRFVEKKGVDLTISAFARIADDMPSAALWLMGSGPEETRLRSLAAATGLGGRIRFIPPSSHGHYARVMRQAHVFVHPSRTARNGDGEGGAPTALLEAQALGVPIVATTHADIPAIVDAEAALLAPEDDAATLARLLLQLIRNPQEWTKRAEAGRRLVAERNDPNSLAHRLEELYDQVRRVDTVPLTPLPSRTEW